MSADRVNAYLRNYIDNFIDVDDNGLYLIDNELFNNLIGIFIRYNRSKNKGYGAALDHILVGKSLCAAVDNVVCIFQRCVGTLTTEWWGST